MKMVAGKGFLAAALIALLASGAHAFDTDDMNAIGDKADALAAALEDTAAIDAPLSAARALVHLPVTAVIDRPTETHGKEGTPVLEMALLGPLLQQLAMETGSQGHRELIEAAAASGGEAVVLRSGDFTLSSLAAAVGAVDRSGVLLAETDGFRLAAPLIIGQDASLALSSGERLTLQTDKGVFILNRGLLDLRGAAVLGSDDAARLPGFRPFILTALGGEAVVDSSRFENLGFDGEPAMGGFALVSSTYSATKSSGSVTGSIFDGIISVETAGIEDFRFQHNRINHARGAGLSLRDTHGARVTDNVIADGGGDGIVVASSRDVAVAGNVIARNGGRGILARGGIGGARIEGNVLLDNGAQGSALEGVACLQVSGNAFLRNRGDGLSVAQSLGVGVRGNLFLRNQGAGLAISDNIAPNETITVSDNRFFANVSGISGQRFGGLSLQGNDFSGQLPVIFAGALQYDTPRFLGWWRGHRDDADARYDIAPSTADAVPGRAGQFRLTELTDCEG